MPSTEAGHTPAASAVAAGVDAAQAALAQGALSAAQQPQIDARLVEGVAAAGQAAHLVARVEGHDADGALELVADARARAGAHNALRQRADLGGRQAAAGAAHGA